MTKGFFAYVIRGRAQAVRGSMAPLESADRAALPGWDSSGASQVGFRRREEERELPA